MDSILALRNSHLTRHRRAYLLAIYLVALNMLDWSLTFYALTAHGLQELNGAVAPFITSPLGFAVKLIIPAIIGWRLHWRAVGDRIVYRMLIGACVLYTLVGLWNSYAIWIR